MIGWRVMLLTMVSVLFLNVASATEEVVEVDNKAYFLCKNKAEVRTIRVQIDEHGICSTHYSKQGSEKNVGSGKNHESCMNFMNNIKTNLEKSNWACRDISASRITASVSEAAPNP